MRIAIRAGPRLVPHCVAAAPVRQNRVATGVVLLTQFAQQHLCVPHPGRRSSKYGLNASSLLGCPERGPHSGTTPQISL